MDKYDQKRKDAVIKALLKAKEKAMKADLYLVVNDRDPVDIANNRLALGYINMALGHLGFKAVGCGGNQGM